jgi:two-component system OmpR family sensor kinase
VSAGRVTGWGMALALAARCAALERRAAAGARRLEAAADAEHELRGALTAFGLGLDRLGRDPFGRRLGRSLASELERARAALADLSAARSGEPVPTLSEPLALDRLARSAAAAWQPAARRAGRRVQVDWRAGPVRVRADRGRLAQALGNLLANAVEHGTGPVRLEARRGRGRVRLEVLNGLRDQGDGEPPGADGGGRESLGGAGEGQLAPGRGRGLRIAARAVEECGGTLSLSRAGGRAAAAVELPLGP